VGSLLAHGRLPETPVALIRWGTTEAQEVRVGTLADIVGRARGLEPPVVAVIGEVVTLREQLAWCVEAAATAAI
jgi:siroheme synthase